MISNVVHLPTRNGSAQEVELPPGSAVWLYHLCAMRADAELLREDLSGPQLSILTTIRNESAIMRDMLLLLHSNGADILGGSAETALNCLDWAASAHQNTANASNGKMREAVLARAATLRKWTEIATEFGIAITLHNIQESCTLYSALINGAVRLVAQIGPQALPILAMLTADLQIFAGVETTRRQIGNVQKNEQFVNQ